MSKLVRDDVPDAGPFVVKWKTAPEKDRLRLLNQKLLEEVGELIAADDKEQALKELGDVVEVLWAIGEAAGIKPEEILVQAYGKREARGGFKKLVLMDHEKEPPKIKPSIHTSYPTRSFESIGDGPWYSG